MCVLSGGDVQAIRVLDESKTLDIVHLLIGALPTPDESAAVLEASQVLSQNNTHRHV